MAVPSKSEIACTVAILDIQGDTAISLSVSARWWAGERSHSGGVRSFPQRALTLLKAPSVLLFGMKTTCL